MEDSEGDLPLVSEIHDLETLVQILAIELVATGKYAVLPRASSMRTALSSWEIRMADERAAALERLIEMILGIIEAPDEAVIEEGIGGAVTAMGQAANADLVLSVETRSLYGVDMFAAQILRTWDGGLLEGVSRGYRNIGGGVNLMAEIAILLTDPDDAPERIADLNRRQRRANLFDDSARFWSVGLSAGTSFADPWAIGTLHATLAPLPFSFIGLGFDVGFISDIEGAEYFSMRPFVHAAFFLPFPTGRGGLYVGAGGGLMMSRYYFDGLDKNINTPTADFTAGINIGNMLDISYTLRTDFSLISSKVSIGFTHRFRVRN